MVTVSKKVSAEKSQQFSSRFCIIWKASVRNWQLMKELKSKLLIFAHLLLPCRKNGSAVGLPFSIVTIRPYRKNGTAVVHSFKNRELWRQLECSMVVQRCEVWHIF